MIGLFNKFFFFFFFFILYIHIESIFYFIFKKISLISLETSNRIILKQNTFYQINLFPEIYFVLYFILMIFFKLPNYMLLTLFISKTVLFSLFFFFLLSIYFNKFFVYNSLKNMFLFFTSSSLLFLNLFFLSITNFLIFFFFLELISVYYYFFFLNLFNSSLKLSFIKFKNFLLFFLWNSFFTSLFFGIGLVLLILNIGSLDFEEIYINFNNTLSYCIFFIFLSLAWKLGLPGFHFFKLQLYVYLDITSIFFFSIFSTFLNVLIYIYFFSLPVVTLATFLNYFSLSLIGFLVIIPLLFRIENIHMFLGLSSIITIFTIFTIILS